MNPMPAIALPTGGTATPVSLAAPLPARPLPTMLAPAAPGPLPPAPLPLAELGIDTPFGIEAFASLPPGPFFVGGRALYIPFRYWSAWSSPKICAMPAIAEYVAPDALGSVIWTSPAYPGFARSFQQAGAASFFCVARAELYPMPITRA